MQGITDVSVQSSVSLQHLPIDKNLEKNLPKDLMDRLSFATQKVVEIVEAASAVSRLSTEQLDALSNPSAPGDYLDTISCFSYQPLALFKSKTTCPIQNGKVESVPGDATKTALFVSCHIGCQASSSRT